MIEKPVEVGAKFKYIGIEYLITEVGNEFITYRRANAGRYDPEVRMRIGSAKYVELFGGEEKPLPHNISDVAVTKASRPKLIETEEDEVEFEGGELEQWIDEITEAPKPEKVNIIQRYIDNIDIESDLDVAKALILYCARYGDEDYSHIEISALEKAAKNPDIKRPDEFDIELITELQDLEKYKEGELTSKHYKQIISRLPKTEQLLMVYVVAGWQLESLGVANSKLDKLLDKLWETGILGED